MAEKNASTSLRKNHELIALTPGEPAGIGPDITLACVKAHPELPIVVVADRNMMARRAADLGMSDVFEKLHIEHVPRPKPVTPGKPSTENAGYILKTLEIAIDGAKAGRFAAVVTGPVNKAVINQAGTPFTGHTEFFARRCGVDQTVMMLLTPTLRVALASTHVPLADVPRTITQANLKRTLHITHQALITRFHIEKPRIIVCGLNPHAGEDGHMGTEEQTIIIPALNECRAKGMDLIGPLPADTAFTPRCLHNTHAVLAMFHDQGLPVLKAQGFGNAVNVTLGLPIIRTSVDHGTAFSLAGMGTADHTSLLEAIKLAQKMAQ